MLRLNEIYHSFQGEGPNTGDPTLFVRFVGCNLKCPGWPCDSQHAIDPKLYRHDMQSFLPSEFANVVADHHFGRDYERICFTGGEVTLQPTQDLLYALKQIKAHTGAEFELFTNGTLEWSEGFREYFDTIVLDWKLPGSGEKAFQDREAGSSTVWRNIRSLGARDAIKFTIKDREDFDEAVRRWDYLATVRYAEPHLTVYAGPVWGSVTAEQVAEWIMESRLPWRLNVQTHKFVWPADKRRV